MFLFIYFGCEFWFLLLGTGFSLVVEIRGYCLIVVTGLLIAVAFVVVDYGL